MQACIPVKEILHFNEKSSIKLPHIKPCTDQEIKENKQRKNLILRQGFVTKVDNDSNFCLTYDPNARVKQLKKMTTRKNKRCTAVAAAKTLAAFSKLPGASLNAELDTEPYSEQLPVASYNAEWDTESDSDSEKSKSGLVANSPQEENMASSSEDDPDQLHIVDDGDDV